MKNLPEDLIQKALAEIEQIDRLLPKELPKYINHKWCSEAVYSYYKLKLAEAGELRRVMDKISKNPNTGSLEIEF